MVAMEGVEDANGVGLVGQVADLVFGGPLVSGCLVGGGEVSPGDLAAEDQGDDAAGHVLVDAGEGDRLDVQAGLLADLAAQAVVDGLARLKDAAGWFPAVVVGALDEQGAAVVVGDDAGHAGARDQPLHVARFGPKFDAQGVPAGSKDAGRCVLYLTKYLTKHIAGCHDARTDGQRGHAARLTGALQYEPCSPVCTNWLQCGIQPKNPRPGLVPGLCKGKAHRPENLGYAGRRVLVSRKWSGKTLADHRADRKAWLTAMLDLPAAEEGTDYQWQCVDPGDPDYLPATHRLLHVLADRSRWREAVSEARRRAEERGRCPAPDGRVAL